MGDDRRFFANYVKASNSALRQIIKRFDF